MANWSGLKKKLETHYLAESLQGRIEYFMTSYRKSTYEEGRIAIIVDGEEIFQTSEFDFWKTFSKHNTETVESEEYYKNVTKKTWDDGSFQQDTFLSAIKRFDNQNIKESMTDENPLVRIFALVDKRVGKRTLMNLESTIDEELDWVSYFYYLRLDAEKIYRTITPNNHNPK